MAKRLPDNLRHLVGRSVKDGEYRILEYRGSGKRGHVLHARRNFGGDRALKFLPREKLTPGWEQEAYKAHRLEGQPNTVRFHEVFFHEAYAVLVFDFAKGDSLRERIASQQLTVGDAEHILFNLLYFRRDCLDKDVRHGDLHPGNIILHESVMGAPRGYEVMVTDFGIGHTGAVLEPKDDFTQIGLMAVQMLQSIRRESLDHTDRLVYDELCHGSALKGLKETSPLERGDERTAIELLVEELEHVRSRAAAPESGPVAHARFGDYLAGEQLGSRWREWENLFVSGFPGYDDIVSQNITVLTGTRGCGKTMVFRRLSTLLALEVGPVDEGAAGALVGFYLNMNDIGDAFLFHRQAELDEDAAKRVIQFFHLSLLSEIVRVAAVAREKAPAKEKDVYDKGNRWLFDLIAGLIRPEMLCPGPGLDMRVAGSWLEGAKDEVRNSRSPPERMAALAESDWLKRFVPGLQDKMPWVGNRPVYFFLDDYSLPRVSEALQTALNSVTFQRSDCFFFKISTESPSTLHRVDYSGKSLDDTHDFELTDLGSVTIDLPDDERERFLDEVFRRRFAREERFHDQTLPEVLGEFRKTWAELARDIRRERGPNGDGAPPSGKPGGRVLYHGRKIFVNMWSGDTRSMVRVALSLLEQLPRDEVPDLPIRPDLQNKVFRRAGGEFLHLLEACTRTSRSGKTQLPGHITSWGKHLVRVAEAFKEIALHELRTRQGGRKDRDEPKQAFRIEIVDKFSLDGIEKEIYEDLVRYGVFLRDDRGKSIRGAIIPRLYLRRLLIPYCTLTFSKIDNVGMCCSDFVKLLLWPEPFAKEWKAGRAKAFTKQDEFEFE